MDNRPIGILDSGVGGLSVLKSITTELPQESIIYLWIQQTVIQKILFERDFCYNRGDFMTDATSFHGKNIAVLGLGVEGLASARFLKKKGALITLHDLKAEQDLSPEILEEAKKLDFKLVLGKDYLVTLLEYDMIVRSPGIKKILPELLEAENEGVVVTSQTKLFFDLCPAMIVGITGTKGKGTTASLLYEMLKKQGLSAYLGGNIGVAPFEFLDNLHTQDIVVLELSSFQLFDLTKSPHIAVLLMMVQEHMDYHSDMTEYVEAKRNLIRYQTADDYAVLNRDYLPTNESDIHTDGQVYYVSRERRSEPGCYVRENAIWLNKDDNERKIIDTKEILLPGKHNLENVCAAVMAAVLAGVEKANIVAVLKTFRGLEHRLELVRDVNGVKYYDDSFSTTPETAVAAIEAFENPEILILGGSSKNSDFTELGKVIREAKNIRAIIGIGDEWLRIKSQISNLKSQILLVEDAKDMRTVVQAVSKIAQPGDVVLLSPACASFGMFRNYKERGEQFKREVNNLLH